MQARAFLVALLLCLAPIAGSVAVADGTTVPQQAAENRTGTMVVFPAENTSEYLAPPADRIDRTDESAATLDVATAVEADAGELEIGYRTETLQRRYRNADSDAERQAIVENAAATLSDRVDALMAREEEAIRRYNGGEIGTEELLGRLGVIEREATALTDALEWVESNAEEQNQNNVVERVALERIRLLPLRGAIRGELASATAGGSASRVHVETAGGGIVLATVDTGGEYRRGAYDPAAKTGDIGDIYQGNPSPAFDRFQELYPWALDSFQIIDALGANRISLYRFSTGHDHGELEAYLDSGSADIVYERQRIDSDLLPVRTLTAADGDLRLVANATRGGGPLEITVEDDGERVDAAVTVNGDPVGSTDGGTLWTVAPRGDTTVNATHDGGSVELSTVLE